MLLPAHCQQVEEGQHRRKSSGDVRVKAAAVGAARLVPPASVPESIP